MEAIEIHNNLKIVDKSIESQDLHISRWHCLCLQKETCVPIAILWHTFALPGESRAVQNTGLTRSLQRNHHTFSLFDTISQIHNCSYLGGIIHEARPTGITVSAVFQDASRPISPWPNAGKRGFRGLSQSRDHYKLSFWLYKHQIFEEKMILAVLEYIVGFAGVVVLSVLCLHHGRHISSQVCRLYYSFSLV